MTDIPQPISENQFDLDLHEVNKAIVRLAYVLDFDITNPADVERLLNTDLPIDHQHFHKIETLKGLILLRGHIRQERIENGLPDGISPTEEPIYTNKKLK